MIMLILLIFKVLGNNFTSFHTFNHYLCNNYYYNKCNLSHTLSFNILFSLPLNLNRLNFSQSFSKEKRMKKEGEKQHKLTFFMFIGL